jgi:hypothetical protein
MSQKTYLELINDVLLRLRENEVASVDQSNYVKLIGKYINDAKRVVEDSYNWNVLSATYTINTTNGVYNYALTGAGTRFRVTDAYNNTNSTALFNESTIKMNELFLTSNVKSGAPDRYNFNGVDSNGDNLTDVYPIPDGVYNLRFNIIKPQADLTVATTKMLVPAEPVIFHALAKAIIERGEDAGIPSGEAYQLFQQSLADHISTESGRYADEFVWGPI